MIEFLDYLGTVVFAITGALAAGRRQMDVFGVVVVATVTSVGGGTLRDMLLGLQPVFWVKEPLYIVTTTVTALITFALMRFLHSPRRMLLVLDALGLAVFTILGCQRALGVTDSLVIVVMMGIMSGTAGGMVRDLLCDKVPVVLRREIYATASLVGGVLFVMLSKYGYSFNQAALASISSVLAIRLFALRRGLSLPVAEVKEQLTS